MKTSHKQTDIDRLRETIQRSFDGKLKKIKEANNKTSVTIQNVKNQIQEANYRTSVSIQNVDNKIQEANKKIVLNTNRTNQLFEYIPQGKGFLKVIFFVVLVYL